jgi:hypothetical protein
MVQSPKSPPPQIRCRQIRADDREAVADLLTRGFPDRPRKYWTTALARLTARGAPEGCPELGYLLEADGAPVGVLLLIFSQRGDEVRCNISSWYVEPAHRGHAAILAAMATKLKHVTYLNTSPAEHTWPILEAQGYRRYSNGIVVALPALQRSGERGARLLAADQPPDAPHAPFERDLMLAHAGFGCIGVWCVTPERALPFVFRPRTVKGVVPCAQLIYCNDVADFVRFAGPIGRFLAMRGRPFIVLDANGPIAGLAGRYFAGITPKYFRGPVAPRLGDLAYTEAALFGI